MGETRDEQTTSDLFERRLNALLAAELAERDLECRLHEVLGVGLVDCHRPSNGQEDRAMTIQRRCGDATDLGSVGHDRSSHDGR